MACGTKFSTREVRLDGPVLGAVRQVRGADLAVVRRALDAVEVLARIAQAEVDGT